MEVVARAAIEVGALGLDGKVRLADEVFVAQPNLLGSILVLQRMGVSMQELEVPLHILLVAFQAMKSSRHHWDTVTEDVQEACMQRLTARLRFSEGLPAELAAKVATQFCDEHAERFVIVRRAPLLVASWVKRRRGAEAVRRRPAISGRRNRGSRYVG
jgi:hypothetical protein